MDSKNSRGGHEPDRTKTRFEVLAIHYSRGYDRTEKSPAGHWKGGANQVMSELRNARDTMPDGVCSDLELPQGSSYVTGVRKFKELHGNKL